MRSMEPQLFLLPDSGATTVDDSPAQERPISWRLDEATRARGQRGIAQARAALRQATRESAQPPSEAPRRVAA